MLNEKIQERGGYDLAEAVTGLLRGTLYGLVHENRIPHHRISKRMVIFSRADLEQWLASHRIETKSKKTA